MAADQALADDGLCTDMLKAYKNFIPHARHYAGKTFTTQIESLMTQALSGKAPS